MAKTYAAMATGELGQTPLGGLSQVAGPREEPLLDQTIPALLAECVAARPDAEAAVFPAENLRLSWSEFAQRVDALAGGLLEIGIETGDRVGIWAPNRPEWVLTQFATARIGAILVNINPAYRVFELEFALRKTGCKALILAERFKSSDYVGMIRDAAPELASAAPGALTAGDLPDLKSVIVCGDAPHPGCFSFAEIEARGAAVPQSRLDAITAALDPDDPINIQFTSGTTGLPKGATLTHRNIVNNANFVTAAMALTEADRLCIPVPFYHCFGMVMGTLGCVTKGAVMVVPGEGFDPESTLRTVSDEGCTALYGVPTMFVAMLEYEGFSIFDLSHLRTGIMAGSPCPIEVMKKVQKDMNMSEVTIAYGMTETSPVSFQSSIDTPLDKRVSSVGRVQPHLEVRIVDEAGHVVPVGAEGELQTRGYSVMQGYWDDPEKTAEAIDADGWMHTGDLARLDADGYCNITGRVKDMIIRGGENISPREIEEFLYTHPGVSQVQVFGIPDDRFGEIVAAWIVPKPGTSPTEEEVRAFCRDKIAHYKVPAVVRFKDALPMTVTGKPQKFVMRDAMIEELGLSTQTTA
ncbi:AMP-binding protein [Roseobacter sinensis]|uniref:AMP-binding protein n=1 Tax=Roseobacter sinensis TaxID=2931391 RepID=A0ABT3BEP0_9RHOB|nr:AMP-binding protein [Roseobacter sp. WL0113]MCV3272023.1 AMP-binding protein [Roseobacter sp. WL0113]